MNNKFYFFDRIDKLFLLPALFILMLFSLASKSDAQDFRHHHNGRWHSHPHTHYHYHQPNIGYAPVVQWFPSGTWMNMGPVNAYQINGKRYVRFGINIGFSRYQGYNTFNYNTGKSRYYRR